MRFLVSCACLLLPFLVIAQQQIVFQDTLGQAPADWKFRNVTPHDWRWYSNAGTNKGGGLRMKLPNDSNYVATSAVNLLAGQTYTLSFKSRMEQGTTSRQVRVGYNRQQFLGGTTYFFDDDLPTDSYNTPPFKEFNPTFTVPQNGTYYFIFNYTQNGYSFTYLDEIVIEKTFLPQTAVTFPAANASYNEGTDLTLTANASDADGSTVKVEFFANGLKLGEDLTAPYEYQWRNILPNDYQLTTKATDNRGNVGTSAATPMRMNFRDGTFGKYVHWDFDKSVSNNFDYWTLKNGDFKTRTGWRNTPCLEIFSAYANNFAASPGVYLRAGETYTLELLGDCSGTKNPRLLVNTQQELGGAYIDTIRINSSDDFNRLKTKTFSVAADGTYYLIINYPVVDNYIQLKFDNVRIIGNLGIPPLSKMTAPDRNIVVAERSNMKLRASVESPENRPIAKVEYYDDGIKIGESLSAPFEFLWENIPRGVHQIMARPYDNSNISALSTKIVADARANQFSASSYLGSLRNDDIRGAVYQKNGTAVLVANLGARPDWPSLQLNGAVDTTQGCVIRLASDGKSILSITRLAQRLSDIALDSSDNIYVGGIAAGATGVFFKLNPKADTILWQKNYSKWVHRLDAGTAGSSIVLTSSTTNLDVNILTGVTCFVYDQNGQELSNFGGASQYTPDVAIDDATQTAIVLGFKNFNTFDSPTGTQTLPVFVPVIKGKNYNGTDRYTGYDWSADRNSPAWLNRSNNNMADVRTSRCAIGKDGRLYITFEVFGGNHVLRYDPFDIMDTVRIVGGDSYFNFSNTGTETKTFVGRYNPATGQYLLGQQFTARLATPPFRGNTIFARNGNVAADETGRVYLTGKSASGLPQTIDYQPGEYTGGAYLLVLSPNLATRETCVRLTNGEGRFVAVQNQNRLIYGGSTSNPLYLTHPLLPTTATEQQGFWATIDRDPCPKHHTLGNNYTNAPQKYEASVQINSAHQLNAGQNVTYDAQRAIVLEKGFEAKAGTVFKAQIEGCGGN
jgi:Bacterial Ig domain